MRGFLFCNLKEDKTVYAAISIQILFDYSSQNTFYFNTKVENGSFLNKSCELTYIRGIYWVWLRNEIHTSTKIIKKEMNHWRRKENIQMKISYIQDYLFSVILYKSRILSRKSTALLFESNQNEESFMHASSCVSKHSLAIKHAGITYIWCSRWECFKFNRNSPKNQELYESKMQSILIYI